MLAVVGRPSSTAPETDEQIKVDNLKQQIDCHKKLVSRSETCHSGQLSKAFALQDDYFMTREMIASVLFS